MGHNEERAIGSGGATHDLMDVQRLLGLVGAKVTERDGGAGGRVGVFVNFDGLHLLDVAQDARKLRRHGRDLVVGQFQACQLRDVSHQVFIDVHEIGLQGRPFCAAHRRECPFRRAAGVSGMLDPMDYYERVRLGSTEIAASRAARAQEQTEQLLKDVEQELARYRVASRAMWELIKQKTDLTDADLQQMVETLADHGALDPPQAVECDSCGRMVGRRQKICLYCEEPRSAPPL